MNFTIPSSPDLVDPKVWTLVPDQKGFERGHTKRWTNAEGQMLAFDKGRPGATGWEGKDHFHVYNKEMQRLQSNGDPAGGVNDGKPFYNKNSKNSHFNPGEVTTIKIKIPLATAAALAKAVKITSKVMVPIAVAGSVYAVATAEDKSREAVVQASGWAGAYAASKVGASAGASIGIWFGGIGAGPGAVIGGFIFGIGGYMGGAKIGEDVYDNIIKK
jgi:hypothetical protein